MKIIIRTQLVGTGFKLEPGEITERFGAAEAQRLITAGMAEPVVETPATAAKRQARARAPRTEQR